MARHKRKITAAGKAAKKQQRESSTIVLIDGKKKRVPRTPTFDGLTAGEFIRRNADPMMHQYKLWEYLHEPSENGELEGEI